MRKIITIAVMMLLLPVSGARAAEHRYVSDILVVNLRKAPSRTADSVTTVKSGTRMTVIGKEGRFLMVRLDNGTEGWIPDQYTIKDPPKADVIKTLKKELDRLQTANETLAAKAEKLAAELDSTKAEAQALKDEASSSDKEKARLVADLRAKLDKINQEYADLRQTAGNAAAIKEERDSLRRTNRQLGAEITALKEENKTLSQRNRLYWFLAGAGTLFLGFLAGRLPSRRQNRSSLTL